MKKILFLLFTFALVGDIEAQVNKYWIEFTDKNGSPYSISNPSAYLSARAIARRAKYGIPIQINDLPPNPAYIDSVVAKGVVLLNRSRWFNAISIYASDTTKMAAIRALPFVKGTKYITAIKPKDKKIKPFRENKKATGVDAVDSVSFWQSYGQVHQIGVDCLNNMGYRGKGKRIAIIDTRFGQANTLAAFDSARARGQILGTHDFVWGGADVYDDTNNTDNHGQMVFSCIGGIIQGQMRGDAVDADYYLLRTEDAASENVIEDDNWASGAEYADSAGADIISSSLGYDTFDDPANNYTYADMNGRTAIASMAATIASEKGMMVCVAAGNEATNSWHYITSPGDADSILTVGAVNSSGAYASFSSTGPTSDGRVKPDVVAQGVGTVVASPHGGVTYENGTSFATPLTAGAVACLWQADSNASNFQLMQAIKESASQYTHPDSLLGYGIPNYCLALNILTGITEHKPLSELVKTYPNPFNNSITLSFFSSYSQHVTVALYNEIGQNVYQKTERVAGGGNTLVTLSGLQNLPGGLYLVTMTDNHGVTFTQKVIK